MRPGKCQILKILFLTFCVQIVIQIIFASQIFQKLKKKKFGGWPILPEFHIWLIGLKTLYQKTWNDNLLSYLKFGIQKVDSKFSKFYFWEISLAAIFFFLHLKLVESLSQNTELKFDDMKIFISHKNLKSFFKIRFFQFLILKGQKLFL